MKIADCVGGLLLLAFAGYILVSSLSMEYVTAGVPGPGFVPFWISIILGIAAVVILVKGWKKPLSGLLIADRTVLWRTVAFALGMAVMVLLIPYLGMVLTLALFMLLWLI